MTDVNTIDDSVTGVVLYPDGGAKPNPGFAGLGIHGYLYREEVPKQGSGLKGWDLTAEGYLENQGKVAKVTPLHYYDAWASLPPMNTNNRAELYAAVLCLQRIQGWGVKKALVMPDSDYVRNGITDWVQGWIAKGWVRKDGTPVPNQDLWKELLALSDALTSNGVVVDWQWVRGHSGHIGNDRADHAATTGRLAASRGTVTVTEKLADAKGYWSRSADHNPLLSQSNWYFNTHTGGAQLSPCGRTVYHMGEHGEDEHFGKKAGDTTVSVVFLKQPDPVLEMVRRFQDRVDDSSFNWVIIGQLNNILSSATYPELLEHGEYRLERPGRGLDLYDVRDTHITKEQRPPKLAFAGIEAITLLEGQLVEYLKGDPTAVVTDVTAELYVTEEKKNKSVTKLKPTITTSTRSLELNVGYRVGEELETKAMSLTVGIDIAKRNTLAALASATPTVKVLTWKESSKAFRYATIIETADDIGIWAGIYSNIHVLTP